jgi:hypothetical protein
MARREDTSDTLEQRWAQHWPMAMGPGIDEANENIYRAHFERNSELTDTFEGRAQILGRGLALQKKWWFRAHPRRPQHPDFVLEKGGELEREALELHREAEAYARTHEMGYAEAYRALAVGQLQVE